MPTRVFIRAGRGRAWRDDVRAECRAPVAAAEGSPGTDEFPVLAPLMVTVGNERRPPQPRRSAR